jgi:hypothetical protein
VLIPFFENCVVVAEVKWSADADGNLVVTEAHCQAAVHQGGVPIELLIEESPADSDEQWAYIRLDFEPENLGGIVFRDPLPHVHARMKGEPRFAVSRRPTAPHIDFIELLIRNFYPRVWHEWAVNVWMTRIGPSAALHERLGGLERMLAAFSENKYRVLCTELREPVLRWKNALQSEKSRMSPLGPLTLCDAIDY